MKKIFPDNKFEKSFIATTEELREMDFPFFDDDCDLCGESSDRWFVFKEAGSGSMDSWICPNCIKRIDRMLDDLGRRKKNDLSNL